MSATLHLLALRIPLRDDFVNAASTLSVRETLLIGVARDGVIGWGEAAPYPGINRETIWQIWDTLTVQPRLATGAVTDALPSTAAAAIDQAHIDHAARVAGVPLWQHLGGSGDPVPATVAIGLSPTPRATAASVYQAHEAGFRAVKLKVAPGHDADHIAAVQDAYRDVSVAVDANGSYRLDDPFFDVIDDFSLAYIEQPFPAARLGDHSMLRTRIETTVNLDESAHTEGSARRAIAERVADMMTLKPGLLGQRRAWELMSAALEAGMSVKASGLIETSVGRAHTAALASAAEVTAADLAPPRWFLSDDVGRDDAWEITNGTIPLNDRPGIGFDIDELALGPIIERSARVDVPGR